MDRKAYFNRAARTWDDRFITPRLGAFLEKLVPEFDLSRGQSILDVGTGTGVLIPYLIKEIGPSGSITAVDYAEKMVEICRAIHSHLPNVNIRLQDVERLDLHSDSFDAVTCFGLFPHLRAKKGALRHMNRVLRPGGKLIIAHALGSAEINARHGKISAVETDILPEKEEMELLLKNAGFLRVLVRDEPGCYLCISYKKSMSKSHRKKH